MPEHEPLNHLRERLSQLIRENLAELDWDVVGLLPSTSLRVDVFLQREEDADPSFCDLSSVNPMVSVRPLGPANNVLSRGSSFY